MSVTNPLMHRIVPWHTKKCSIVGTISKAPTYLNVDKKGFYTYLSQYLYFISHTDRKFFKILIITGFLPQWNLHVNQGKFVDSDIY